MSEFKVDKLGYYRTRLGKTVRVVCVDAPRAYPVISVGVDEIRTHTKNGMIFEFERNDFDLIAYIGETPEPVKGSLAWARSLPPKTWVWNEEFIRSAKVYSDELTDDEPLKAGWYVVGTPEWANALPLGTRVCGTSWDKGEYITRTVGGWRHYSGQPVIVESGRWELYREPKLRPWKPEEVPVGALVRIKGAASRFVMTGICEEEVNIGGLAISESLEELLKTHEHSLDGGKTWLPCGVAEDA